MMIILTKVGLEQIPDFEVVVIGFKSAFVLNKDDVNLQVHAPVVMRRNQCSGPDLVEVIGVEPPGGVTL